MSAAVYRHSIWHLSAEQDLYPAQSTDNANCSLYALAKLPDHASISLLIEYVTRSYNPAFDIHPQLMDHGQNCHQHHSLLPNSATSPYNPAFDIHPKLTDHCQTFHQHHPQLPLAPPVQDYTRHKRPP